MSQGQPSAQGPFARFGHYPRRRGVQHHVGGRYPAFIAHTDPCVRPNPSHRLRSLPWSVSPGRLSPVPAGRWPFPTLSPQSLYRSLDPYPAAPLRCFGPLLPEGHRPRLRSHGLGAPENRRNATSTTREFRGCSHSVMFRLPYLPGPPIAPTAAAQRPQGGRALYATQCPRGYPSSAVALLHA